MKVLGVSGSPVYDSNTDRALRVALEAAAQSVGVNKFEEQLDVFDAARELGKRTATALTSKSY